MSECNRTARTSTTSTSTTSHPVENEGQNGRSIARRELFRPQSCNMDNQQVAMGSKWWRSCWNGQQLDGELLYRTVKEQQERRLLASLKSVEANKSPEASTTMPRKYDDDSRGQAALVDGSRQSYVYAVPRASSARQPQVGSPNELTTGGCSASSSPMSSRSTGGSSISSSNTLVVRSLSSGDEDEDQEEDPLSDPLYASVLGTSKQLKAMSSRAAEKNASKQTSSELDSSQQLQSLAERCLEVQRATRNGNLLLVRPEDEPNGGCQEQDDKLKLRSQFQEHQDCVEEKKKTIAVNEFPACVLDCKTILGLRSRQVEVDLNSSKQM